MKLFYFYCLFLVSVFGTGNLSAQPSQTLPLQDPTATPAAAAMSLGPTATQTPYGKPVGNTTPTTCKSSGQLMGYEKVHFPKTAYVDGIWVYGSSVATPGPLQAGLYSDGGGAPASLIVSSRPQTKVQGWQYVPFTQVLMTPGNAWIGVYMSDQFWMINNDSGYWMEGPGQMPAKPVSLISADDYRIGVYADTRRVWGALPTRTYTFTPAPTATSTPNCGGTACNTPTPTPTWNSTPVASQLTPVSQVIAYFGDSYLGYCQPHPFPDDVNAYLAALYPGTSGIVFYGQGVTSQIYLDHMVGHSLASIWTHNEGPMTKAVLILGMGNEVCNYNAQTCDSCVIDQTASSGIALSYVYKAEMKKIIRDILDYQPGVELVICTLPDPNNNGAGPYFNFCPQTVKLAFNQRIMELAHDQHLKVADLYTAMMGCNSCFGTTCDSLHPSPQGDRLIAQLIEAQFAGQ